MLKDKNSFEKKYMEILGIKKENLVSCSYNDLLLE